MRKPDPFQSKTLPHSYLSLKPLPSLECEAVNLSLAFKRQGLCVWCLFLTSPSLHSLFFVSVRAVEVKRKAVQRIEEQLMKLQVQATDREENKQIALGTSKLNYLDPRISVAWYMCDQEKSPGPTS